MSFFSANDIYVTPEGKRGLLKYKYVGQDNSFLSPYFQGFWNWSVEMLPMTMAPNMVTLIAFAQLTLAFVVTAYYSHESLAADLPTWVYLLDAWCLFAYQTLDAIDGKQARRTKSSSPLGELFDHGCDALGGSMQTLTIAMVCKAGLGWAPFIIMASVNIMFFFSIWEQSYTYVLNFHPLTGPTEALCLCIAVMLLTAVLGADVWVANTLFGKELVVPILNIPLNFINFFMMVTFVSVVFVFLQGVSRMTNAQLDPELVKRKGHPHLKLVPFISSMIIWTLWFFLSPSQILQTHTFACCLAVGTVNAYLTTRVILCRVTDMPIPELYVILIPLPFMLLNALLPVLLPSQFAAPIISEFHALAVYLVFVYVLYAHFATVTIGDITEYLGIHAFSLKKKVSVLSKDKKAQQ